MHCIVVGAGLLGLTTAWFLRQNGADVTLVERESGPGLETSFANGGMLHASQASPWNEPGVVWQALRMLGQEDAALLIRPAALPRMLPWVLRFFVNSQASRYNKNVALNARLAQYSLRVLEEHFSGLSTSFGRQDRGTMKIYRSQDDFDAAAAVAERCRDFDIAFTIKSVSDVLELEPALTDVADKLVGGIHFPGDVSGDAHQFCRALAAACADAGVVFSYETETQGISLKNGRAIGVDSAIGFRAADAVIVAAGSYSHSLAKTAGVHLQVQPVKGYSITIPMESWAVKPEVPVIDEHYHAAVCPLGTRLRVAGTAEFAGFDKQLTATRIGNLFDLVRGVYPAGAGLIDEREVLRWAGLRPMSPDGVGIMGETAVDGLYVNTGHGHLGWTMAPAAGKLVADRVFGRNTELPIEDYLPARFN